MSGDFKMLGDVLLREARCQPNAHEPLPHREASEGRSGYADLSVVWIAVSIPDHELIGSKRDAASGPSVSPPLPIEKTAATRKTSGAGAVNAGTWQGSFYPRGSLLPGSLPDWNALNSR